MNRRHVAGFLSTADCLINAVIYGVLTGIFFSVAEACCRKGLLPALVYLILSATSCLLILLTNRIIAARAAKHDLNNALTFAQGFGECIVFASILPWGWTAIRAVSMLV